MLQTAVGQGLSHFRWDRSVDRKTEQKNREKDGGGYAIGLCQTTMTLAYLTVRVVVRHAMNAGITYSTTKSTELCHPLGRWIGPPP